MVYNSKESSASTHICILPSRYNRAYSSGSSIASVFNAQSDRKRLIFRYVRKIPDYFSVAGAP